MTLIPAYIFFRRYITIEMCTWKFGVELETLLYLKGEKVQPYFNFLKRLRLRKEESISRRSIRNYTKEHQTMIRTILMNIYQATTNQQVGLNFRCDKTYHGTSFLYPENTSEEAKADTNWWTIAHDGSVKLAEDTRRLTNFYGKLDYLIPNNGYNNDEESSAYCNDKDKRTTFFVDPQVIEHMEFVSPILNDDGDLLQTLENVKSIITFKQPSNYQEIVMFNNSTTSHHVHLSCNYDSKNLLQAYDTSTQVHINALKICLAWYRFEDEIMTMFPPWRTARCSNEYCQSMHQMTRQGPFGIFLKNLFHSTSRTDITNITLETITKALHSIEVETEFHHVINLTSDLTEDDKKLFIEELKLKNNLDSVSARIRTYRMAQLIIAFQGNPFVAATRYAAFNLMNLFDGRYGTIEVRLKHGSDDMKELYWAIQFYKFFMEKAMSIQTSTFISTLRNASDLRGFLNHSDVLSYIDSRISAMYGNCRPNNDQAGPCAAVKEIASAALASAGPNVKILITKLEPGLPPNQMDYAQGGSPPGFDRCKKRVFCYGSNGVKQLRQRTGMRLSHVYPAYLPNMTRIFAGYSSRWDGGVAGIYPQQGHTCYGIVVELTDIELQKLDTFEGGYTRVQKYAYVTLPDGQRKKAKCEVYVKNHVRFSRMPSTHYLKAIRDMLNEVRLTDSSGGITVRGLFPTKPREAAESSKEMELVLKDIAMFKNGKLQMLPKKRRTEES